MKNWFLFLLFVCVFEVNTSIAQQSNWQPVGNKIRTPWAEKVNSSNPLPEYPRPQMVRENWQTLNGLWDYALQPKSQEATRPTSFNGKILVPFAVESSLSGVG